MYLYLEKGPLQRELNYIEAARGALSNLLGILRMRRDQDTEKLGAHKTQREGGFLQAREASTGTIPADNLTWFF